MNIVVSGLHLKNFPELEDYARKKVAKFAKFYPKILKVDVRLIAKEAHRDQDQDYTCEIQVTIPGNTLEINDNERSMDKAIDKAVERMQRLLTRTKEKKISKMHKIGILNKIKSRFF